MIAFSSSRLRAPLFPIVSSFIENMRPHRACVTQIPVQASAFGSYLKLLTMGKYHANGLGAICARRERELWRPTPVINGFRPSHFSTLSSQAQQKEKRTNNHEKFMSSALQATKKSSRALLCNLKLEPGEVGLCTLNHEGLGVVAGDGKSGIAVLGHHGDVLGSSDSKSAVHDLRLQNEVLLLLLTNKAVH